MTVNMMLKRTIQVKSDSRWLTKTLFLFFQICLAIQGESRVVRVGLFPAAPLVFEKNGKPQGLFIDLLECFANKNQWNIKYINGTWDHLQVQLLNGDIDLLPAIGYTKERVHLFDFNKNPIFVENGVLFTNPKFKVHTIFDLNNKRVAGVKGSIFTTGFNDYVNSFGILCEIIHTKDNREVMEAILSGKADAGICIYSLGNELAKKYPVVITPISFSPIALHYAVCKSHNADLLSGIDTLMNEMVRDPNSEYSVLYSKSIDTARLQNIPIWLSWGLIGLFSIGSMFAIWSFSLNRLVKIRTRHLKKEISERKLIADDLQVNRERLELATRSAHIGIWDWNILTNELIWDDQMYQIYGIFQKPVSIGVEFWQKSVHPDDYSQAWEATQAAIRGEKKYDIEFRIVQPDGKIRSIKADGTILRNDSGEATRMLGINRDITRQKEIEEAHLKYELQIQKNSKIEALGVLAGGIAHDFNNLMGGIYGYIEIVMEGCRDATVSKNLTKAVNSIERARALTLQLLTFAKGGAPVMKTGQLFPFVQETAMFALSGSNITYTFDIPSNLHSCSFDKNQISQVIDNIVINAKQAMPDGGRIVISAKNISFDSNDVSSPLKGDYVKISIQDSGTGIPKEIQPKIFDPFFTTKATGHGLGLASCYSIIKRHGGLIDVESEPGKGSTFIVYLPASKDPDVEISKPLKIQHTGCGMFIVVDDEEVMLEVTKEMLRDSGYSVICWKNGEDLIEFIKSIENDEPQIAGMLIDLTIPGGMGGKEIIQEIRKINLQLPVFVTSGYAEDPIIAQPARYGFTASICKPFRRHELMEMLQKYCLS